MKEVGNILLLLPLLAVLCTALVVNDELANPTISGKYVWFGIALPVCMLSGLLALLLKRKPIRLSAVDWLLAAFCFWGISRTFFLTGEFSLRLSLFFMVWAFYVVCRLMFFQFAYYQKIVSLSLVVTGLVEALWGTGQLHGCYPSQHSLFLTTGSFYNSGPYGGFLAVTLPLAIYYVLQDFQVFNQKLELKHLPRYAGWILCTIALLAIISILPSTMSRAAWIAGVSGSALVVFCHYVSMVKSVFSRIAECRKRTFWPVLLLIFLAVASLLAGVYSLKKDSADGRMLIWKISSGIIAEHPLGVGIARFPGYYGEAQVRYFSKNWMADPQEELVAGNPEYAFNEYIQIAVEQGIPACAAFVLLSLFALFFALKDRKYGVAGALLSLLLFAFFSYPFSLLPFPIILAVLLALCANAKKSLPGNTRNCWRWYAVFLLLLFVPVAVIVYQRWPTYTSYREWRTIKMLKNSGIYKKQALNYQLLYSYLKHESAYLFEYAQCLNRLGRYEESNRILKNMKSISCDPMIYNVMGRNFQSMKMHEQAEACFRKSAAMVPNRLYPHYLLMKLYEEKRDTLKMQEAIAVVLEKEPKVDSPAIREMKQEARQISRRIIENE
jgi:tetratricopeptide (TPR) repeat protein